MSLTIGLSVALFAAIMLPTVLISAAPGLAVTLLELLRLFPKGALRVQVIDGTSGGGYQRRSRAFLLQGPGRSPQVVTGAVFGKLILACLPASLSLGLLAAALVG